MILSELFINFLFVGLFSVGGGYAAIPLIQSRIVEQMGWLGMEEFTNLMTIAEMTPGPIAVNSATFVGVRLAGLPGAIAATLGCIAPSLLIVSAFALAYRRYRSASGFSGALGFLRPAVVALIATAGISILKLVVADANGIKSIETGLFAAALIALRCFKVNPILVLGGCGAAGLAFHFLMGGVIL